MVAICSWSTVAWSRSDKVNISVAQHEQFFHAAQEHQTTEEIFQA